MSNVEVLGKPFYRPVKHKLQDEQIPLVEIKSNESTKSHINTNLVYERDESDWWWCEDV